MERLKRLYKIENIFLLIIIAVAIFLRTYNHKQLLNFQLDQARDAIIATNFINQGLEKIPLLGPHVTGGELQLGPIFYYIQAIPAFIFGVSPNALAMPDLFFSVLLIPLLYLFLRLYFPKNISLAVCVIAATSLFLIIFGRFAWNPNSLPFFTLLAAYGLLRSKANDRENYDPKWFYLAVFGAAIASQLHFVYFLAAPFIFILYLIFWKPKLKLKHWLISLLIVLAIYTPVIISEAKTGGASTKDFFRTITGKETKKSKHNIAEKSFDAYQELQGMYWGILTSNENKNSIATQGFNLKCNKECRSKIPLSILQCLFFLSGIALSAFFYRKEKDDGRKKFILMAWIWLASMFLVFTLLAYQMYSRYYLAVAALFFVLLAFFFEGIQSLSAKRGKYFVLFLAVVFVFFNLQSDMAYLKEHHAMAQREVVGPRGSYFFNDEKVTLEQLEKVVSFIKNSQQPEQPIKIVVDNKYARPLYYLLTYQNNIPSCYIKLSAFHPTGASDYFIIFQSDWEKELSNDSFGGLFFIQGKKSAGNLDVFYIEAKNPDPKISQEEACLAE